MCVEPKTSQGGMPCALSLWAPGKPHEGHNIDGICQIVHEFREAGIGRPDLRPLLALPAVCPWANQQSLSLGGGNINAHHSGDLRGWEGRPSSSGQWLGISGGLWAIGH